MSWAHGVESSWANFKDISAGISHTIAPSSPRHSLLERRRVLDNKGFHPPQIEMLFCTEEKRVPTEGTVALSSACGGHHIEIFTAHLGLAYCFRLQHWVMVSLLLFPSRAHLLLLFSPRCTMSCCCLHTCKAVVAILAAPLSRLCCMFCRTSNK